MADTLACESLLASDMEGGRGAPRAVAVECPMAGNVFDEPLRAINHHVQATP